MKKIMLFLVAGMVVTNAHAELVRKTVEYKQGATTLEGYLVYNQAEAMSMELKPGIVVVHEWMGLNDYAQARADQLAELGYIVFAADIYGKGIRPNTPEAAGEEAGKYKNNRALLRARVIAALEQLKAQAHVDPDRLAAIGYCFGGTTVLELARAGADVKGVVSFHGGLNQGDIQNKPIKARILVLHGDKDPFVPASEVAGFEKEMADMKADYKIMHYGTAMHGFTNPKNQGQIPGAQYNARADLDSWKAMQDFLNQLFGIQTQPVAVGNEQVETVEQQEAGVEK